VLGTALVDTYAKCGLLAKAQQVLEELPVRDEVTWNALLTGYVQQGQDYEALKHFTVMQREGLSPDEVTFSCALKACGAIGAIDKGIQIHEEISSKGLIKTHTMLGTALVDMYVKCGVLGKAEKVLQELPCRDTFSWNALIAGYAEGGDSSRVLECFEKMQREGLPPDDVTFLCILNACSRTGKSVEAQVYYENMSKKYGITPKVEHHTCMIVVYGSEGQFDKAMSVIETMPSFSDPSVWLALLSACKKWGNVKLGRFAFENVTRLDENVGAAYVLMVSIYAAADMLDEARNVESMRMKKSMHVFNGEQATFV
jgi:pentatricopeptide repeat protein